MTFEQWWEQAEKPFGEARSFKEAALAGWEARQKVDAEICRGKGDPLAIQDDIDTRDDIAKRIEKAG